MGWDLTYLSVETEIPRRPTEAACLASEKHVSVALVQPQCVQDELDHHDDAGKVLGPAPAAAAGDKGAADDRPQGRGRGDGDAVADHGGAPLAWGPDVDDGAASDGDGGAAEDAGEEPCN